MLDPQNKNAAPEGCASDVFGDQAKTAVQNDQPNDTSIPASSATIADEKAKLSRSTSTEAQIAKLRAFLREGPKTTHFLRMMGISHPAGRVNDLRKADWEILTQRVHTTDSDGYNHVGVAKYVLLKEPPQQLSLNV
jgi:hypothetical protein